MNLTEKFLQFSLLGANWVLWVLVALSMASVAIIVERYIYYRSLGKRDIQLTASVCAALAKGDQKEAASVIKGITTPGSKMVHAILQASGQGITAMNAMLAATRSQERLRLERNLSFLGTVGSNAPFIGLFGTVIEILKVFNQLGAQGVASGEGAQQIMTGISEALVATAIGLLVAIPAVVAFNTYQRRVKRLMSNADGFANTVVAQLSESLIEGKK